MGGRRQPGLVTVTLRIDPEIKAALEEQATRDFRDTSSQIRKVLSQWHTKWVSNNNRAKKKEED